DTYNPRSIEFIVVSGILTGSDISVEGASYKVNITDAPASFGLADLNGHAVTVKGYFAGIAAPVIKILAAEVQDDGLFKVIYLSEDFNFLPAAYGNKILYATSPSEVRFSSWKWEDPDGREKWGWTSTPAPDAAAKPATAAWLYAREGYVKLGKTAVAGDLISPKLSALEDETVDVVVTFKACGYQTADGVQDIGHHLNISVIGPGTVSTPQFALEYYKTKEDGGDTYIWQDDSSNAYSFEITGATAETQIRFLAGPNIGVITTLGPNNSNRVAIDDIEVIKAN
ncbi:MAG: hypothetical protein LBL13_14175, partial [Bacteroidales bacterium]|nr:hypothetical protein [Bacteroidales bacterium]